MERVLSVQPEAQEWLEVPFLCSRSALKARCVSWSGNNLIACTSVDGVYLSKGTLTYPIYIIPVNMPYELHTIFSPHTSPIKALEWAALSFGNLLLSSDESHVCVWQQLDSISTWKLVESFAFDLPLAVHWIGSDEQRFSHGRTETDMVAVSFTGFELSRSAEVRHTSLVGVSAAGAVTTWTQRPFEPHWGVMRAELGSDLILHSAAVACRRGGLVVAAAGPSFGNMVSIYDLATESERQQPTVHLTARVTLPESGIPSQLQLLALPSGMLRLLAVRTRLDGIPDTAGVSEVWEESGTVLAAPSVAASPLQVVTPSDDSQSNAVLWKRLSVIPVPNGVSLVHFINHRHLFFGYDDGRFEFRLCDTGQLVDGVLNKADSMRIDSETTSSAGVATHSSKRHKAAAPQKSPVAVCISPNRTCAALLYRSGAVSVFHATPLLDRDEEGHIRLVSQLERALFLGYDCWDILIAVYANQLDEPGRAPLQRLITELYADLSSLPPTLLKLRNHLSISIDGLKAVLFRGIPGVEVLASDAFARQGLRLAHDVTRSLLLKPSLLPSEALQEGTAELENLWKQANPPTAYVDNDQLQPLFLLTEWVLDLAALLVRNAHAFSSTIPPAVAGDPLLEAAPDGWLTVAVLQGLQLPPLLSFLLDLDTLKLLREMLVLSHLVREQLASRRLLTPVESAYAPQSIRALQEVIHRVILAARQQPENAGTMNSLQAICAATEKLATPALLEPLKSTQMLTDSLRLLPAQGTLFSQLQLDLSNGIPMPKHRFAYTASLDTSKEGRADVLTRATFVKEERKGNVRQCVRCGSFASESNAPDSRDKEPSWLRRWDLACPMCGGVWLSRPAAK